MSSTADTIAQALVPTSPLAGGVTLNAVTDVGAIAEALAAVFKLADSIFAVVNTPVMVAARNRVDVQAILNEWDSDLEHAQKTGDVSQVDRDSSG
jgi:hypothetical protein